MLEGAGPISPETAERLACDARRLDHQAHAAATSCTHASDAAPPTPNIRALHKRSPTANTPAAPPTANSKLTTSSPVEHGGTTELDNLILLCPRHHKHLHDHHIRTSGNGETPTSKTTGRAITANQPHAPPC